MDKSSKKKSATGGEAVPDVLLKEGNREPGDDFEANVDMKKQIVVMVEMMRGLADRLQKIEDKLDSLEKNVAEIKREEVPAIKTTPASGSYINYFPYPAATTKDEPMDESEDDFEHPRPFGRGRGTLFGKPKDGSENHSPFGPGPSLFVGGPLGGGRCGGLGACSFC